MPIDPTTPAPDDDWSPFSSAELADRLGATRLTWYVVGGWALDLWHGQQTRPHADLEFAVLPGDIAWFRTALTGLAWFMAHAGQVRFLGAAEPPAQVSQLWGLDPVTRRWRVDMMLERGTPSEWVYKRDPAIRAPRAAVIRRDAAGIPYLAPATVLLFKARHRRDKDEIDFAAALPRLQPSDRRQLRDWLTLAEPGHDWLGRL